LRLYESGEATPRIEPSAPVRTISPAELASRELIRPIAHRRIHPRSEPLSIAWLDELEHKRFTRHGAWLPQALEFGRHPGESVLCLNPGLGADAIRFLQCGSEVTIGISDNEDVGLIRTNLERHALHARVASISGSKLPFADGAFDIVVVNGLYAALDGEALSEEFFRILKCGGKVIGLFPAYYDAGYWQDLLLPYQHLYWRRPADPTTAPKTTARELRRAFSRFS